ncbi:DUF637 domain-containing protein [Vibrio europaeus]|uniref:DUF637 domain-containing protein n=1 Tax=Vibrio europaeus TaxID=300876 RepID=UPI00233F879B|nr:DUF637 domain-containing protein [Vibrio europaeus]MDC5850545.1 DUF637 domain-containing protein [Vibrio europaeus]
MIKNRIDAPLWQKVTSSVLTAVLATHLSFPVYASVKTSVTLENIQSAISASPRYELQQSVKSYLHRGALESDELGIFDGFTYFFSLLSEGNPQLLPGYDEATQKAPSIDAIATRFGSPYVERGVIRHQIAQILNKSWISAPGYSSYNEQTKRLYENAAEVAATNGFRLGQQLTRAQIDNLSKDIVWPELRTINGQQYLVPFVYLTEKTVNAQKIIESTFSANSADIKTKTFVVNGGRVEFKHSALIDVEQDFINTQGTIDGHKFTIRTGRELKNLSGTISGDDVTLIANKLTNDTLVTRTDYGHGFSETFRQLASIQSLGDLNIHTAGDVISHGGEFSAQGDLAIKAGGNIILVPQSVKNERAESGAMWSDSESSLVNLQTSLSAVDTLSLIAGGQVFIEGAKLESQGLLEILAGYGITLKSAADLKSYEKKFESDSGGLFGSKESEAESKTEAEIVRTLLKAGQSMLLSTKQGNVLLEAVTIDNKGMSKIIAENGSIDFELAKLLETYSYEKSFEGALSFRHKGNGYQREVAYYSEFINNGGLLLDAATGINIQVAAGTNNLDHTLAELARSPELAWMQDLRNNPELQDIDWQSIELVYEQWDYDQSGLSAAAMAILAIAMAVATGGAGLAIAGASGSLITATGITAAAINAGFNAIVLQASASLLANGFDFQETLQDLSSKEALASVATSMVTAGVISAIDSSFFVPAGAENTTTIHDLTGFATDSLKYQAIQQLVHTTASSGVHAIVNGHSLDEFGDSLLQSVALSSIAMLGKELANEIGEAAHPKVGPPQIDKATQLIAHAALGCALGSLTSAANGSNSSALKKSCASGAAGGAIGEYVASKYKERVGIMQSEAESFAKDVFDDLENADPTLSQAELMDKYQHRMMELTQLGIDVSKLVSGITVFAFGGEVDVAISTAGNAAENNAFFIIPALIAAANAVLIAMTAYDAGVTIHNIYLVLTGESEIDPKEAIIDLLIGFGINATLKKVPLDKLPFDELVELAQKTLVSKSQPELALELGKMTQHLKVDTNGKVVPSGSTPPVRYAKPSSMSDEDYGKYLTHRQLAPHAKLTPEQVVAKLKTHDYEPDRGNGTWVKKDLNITTHNAKPVEKLYDEDFLNLNDKIEVKGVKGPLTVKEATEHRQKLLEQSRLAESDPNVRKPSPTEINVFSEALGEMRAKKYAADNDLGEELANKIPGSKQSNFVFDQVYVKDGRVTILEAKGSISESPSLSGHTIGEDKFMQGTKKYFESMMTHMEKATHGLAPDHPYRKAYDAIELARESGQLDYKMVVQTISPATGELGNTLVKTYDII